MSKPDDAPVRRETEQSNPDRRTAMMPAAGAAAASIGAAVPASGSSQTFSPEFLECKRLWDEWGRVLREDGDDAAGDALQAQFNAAEQRLLARPPRTLQDLRERAILWELDDSRDETEIETGVLEAIRALVPGGLNV